MKGASITICAVLIAIIAVISICNFVGLTNFYCERCDETQFGIPQIRYGNTYCEDCDY